MALSNDEEKRTITNNYKHGNIYVIKKRTITVLFFFKP